MKIEHVAIWVKNIESMKAFYVTYFNGSANEKYHNPNKQFESYFITFESGARLELMTKPDLDSTNHMTFGWAHIAFSLGSKELVDFKTEELGKTGFTIADGPRTTGDGYYESVILDPEGNHVEITI